MRTYLITASNDRAGKNPDAWTVECRDFGASTIVGDEGLVHKGVEAVKRMCMEEGMKMLKEGKALPAPTEGITRSTALEDFGDPEAVTVIRFLTDMDMDEAFLKECAEPARRNVSMPGWMDIKLRRYSIDASKLFQDAAAAKIAEMESGPAAKPQRITDASELEDICDPGVLDTYVKQRLNRLLEG